MLLVFGSFSFRWFSDLVVSFFSFAVVGIDFCIKISAYIVIYLSVKLYNATLLRLRRFVFKLFKYFRRRNRLLQGGLINLLKSS